MKANTHNSQEKVVFVIDHNVNKDVLPISDKSFNYVSKTLDAIMLSHNVSTDNFYIGGSKRSISVWISNIISLYHLKQLEIEDGTLRFNDDPDFDN
jgi:hypothetical protein